jgi:hypothetical protein
MFSSPSTMSHGPSTNSVCFCHKSPSQFCCIARPQNQNNQEIHVPPLVLHYLKKVLFAFVLKLWNITGHLMVKMPNIPTKWRTQICRLYCYSEFTYWGDSLQPYQTKQELRTKRNEDFPYSLRIKIFVVIDFFTTLTIHIIQKINM